MLQELCQSDLWNSKILYIGLNNDNKTDENLFIYNFPTDPLIRKSNSAELSYTPIERCEKVQHAEDQDPRT